jgi:hypothetical protein
MGSFVPDEIVAGCATLEWIQDIEREFGRESDVFKSRVMGQYPTGTPNALLTKDVCLNAATVKPEPDKWVIFGVDVAYEGNDRSVVTILSGNTFWKEPFVYRKLNGYKLSRKIKELHEMITKLGYELKAIAYDEAGIATALHENLQGMYNTAPISLIPVNFSSIVTAWRRLARHNDMHLSFNKRAEMYLDLRRLVLEGKLHIPLSYEFDKVIPKIKYFVNKRGLLQIQSKQEYKKKNNESPDIADSVILALHAYILNYHLGRGSRKIVQ